jgi:prolyl-tRNA synthetase
VSDNLTQKLGLTLSPASGVYMFTPLGFRIFDKLCSLISGEFERIGALRYKFPILTPSHDLKDDGARLQKYESTLLVTKAAGRNFVLNPSSEETAAWTALSSGPLSYRNLPRVLFDIGPRFRASVSAHGFHRAHEFHLMEAYGIASDVEAAGDLYQVLVDAATGVFSSLGLGMTTVQTLAGPNKDLPCTNFYLVVCSGGQRPSVADERLILDASGSIAQTAVTKDAGLVLGDGMELARGFRVAQVTSMGSGFSKATKLRFQDEHGKHAYPVMVNAGISLNKLLCALAEVSTTVEGVSWPAAIAPFDVAVVALGAAGQPHWKAAEALSHTLASNGHSLLFDDRQMDTDRKIRQQRFVGAPIRAIVGARGFENGLIDIETPNDTIRVPLVDAHQAIDRIARCL